MSSIDFRELKGRVDIQAACSLIDLDLKCNGNQLRGPCPACQSGGDRSLVVTPAKGAAYCFAAKKGGDVILLASHIRGTSQKDAAQFLDEAFGGAVKIAGAHAGPSNNDSSANTSTEREMKPFPASMPIKKNWLAWGCCPILQCISNAGMPPRASCAASLPFRCMTTPQTGSGLTTTTAPIWGLAPSHPPRN